jgi:hypothetical protein
MTGKFFHLALIQVHYQKIKQGTGLNSLLFRLEIGAKSSEWIFEPFEEHSDQESFKPGKFHEE